MFGFRHSESAVANGADDREWIAAPMYGGSETRHFVRKSDGRILVEIIHGSSPGASWDVFKNGSGRGNFLTEEQAKAYAETLV